MEDNVNESILLVIEILIFAILLWLTVLIVNITYAFENEVVTSNDTFLNSYKELFKYDKTIVKGYEIPGIIKINARKYKFIINCGLNQYEISLATERSLGRQIWEEDYVSNLITLYMNNDFDVNIILDKYNNVLGLAFTKK